MKAKIFFILVVLSQLIFAQKSTYYDKQGNEVSKNKAAYYKEVSKTDNKLWKTQEFYISGTLKFEGISIKKDGKEKVGEHNSYYPSGELLKKSRYENDKLMLSERFYKSANLKRKSVYESGLILSVHDYYNSGQLKNEVYFSGTLENRGIKAKSYYENGNLKRDDDYIKVVGFGGEKYELINGLCLSEDGNEIDHTPFIRFPHFPGGSEMLKMYLSINVKYPEVARKQKTQGKVIVKFVVNKKGEIGRTKVVRSVSYELDKEALRVVNSMPNWIPGIQYGKIVNVSFSVPINFKLL